MVQKAIHLHYCTIHDNVFELTKMLCTCIESCGNLQGPVAKHRVVEIHKEASLLDLSLRLSQNKTKSSSIMVMMTTNKND